MGTRDLSNKLIRIEKRLELEMQPEILAIINASLTEEEKRAEEEIIRRSGYTGIIIEIADRKSYPMKDLEKP